MLLKVNGVRLVLMNDYETLFQNNRQYKLMLYATVIASRLLPFLCIVFCRSMIITIIGTIIFAISFYATMKYFGPILVGYKWSIDLKIKFPYIATEINPSSENVDVSDSDLFWISLVGSNCLWFALAVIYLVTGKGRGILILIIWVADAVNAFGFMKCHSQSRQQADNAVRSLLLNANASFPAAQDIDGSESDEAEEESQNAEA